MNTRAIIASCAWLMTGFFASPARAASTSNAWLKEGCVASGYRWDDLMNRCACPSNKIVVDGACVSDSYAPQDRRQILGGFFDAYSPALQAGRMWIGGWLTRDDMCPPETPSGKCGPSTPGYGEDKIYYSDLLNDQWTWPTLS